MCIHVEFAMRYQAACVRRVQGRQLMGRDGILKWKQNRKALQNKSLIVMTDLLPNLIYVCVQYFWTIFQFKYF